MKCIEFNQLAAYVDGVLEQEEKINIDKHLEFCPSCRGVVETLQKEDLFLEQAINSPVLPAGFDEEVLSNLEPYQPNKEKRNWSYELITAASIVLAFGVGAAFYGGVERNTSGSATQVPVEAEENASYEDKILVNVNEVSASPLRIEIFYDVIPDEKVLQEFLKKNNVTHLSQVDGDYWPLPRLKITDEKGVELPWREFSKGHSQNQDSLVIKPSEIANLPDNIIVELRFSEFFMASGDWKVNVPIDLTEAKAATSTHPILERLEFDTFYAEILDWESAHNANRLTVQSSYNEAEIERLQTILEARGNASEYYPVIEPELTVMTEDGKKLVIDSRDLHSNMGKGFTMKFDFLNRSEGMEAIESFKLDKNLILQIEGFRIQEPENTQFDLTDSSENVQVNDWTVESVATEPGNGSTKIVTIKGKTTIKNIETVTTEIKTDKEWVTPDITPTQVGPDGTFTIQTTLPNSTTHYYLDIQTISKWQVAKDAVFVLQR